MKTCHWIMCCVCLLAVVACDKPAAPAVEPAPAPAVEPAPTAPEEAAAPAVEARRFAPRDAACAWEVMAWGDGPATCDAYVKHELAKGEHDAVKCEADQAPMLEVGRYKLSAWSVCLYADCSIKRGVFYSYDTEAKTHAISTFAASTGDGDDTLTASVVSWSATRVAGGDAVVVKMISDREGTTSDTSNKRKLGALLSLGHGPVWVDAWAEQLDEGGVVKALSEVKLEGDELVVTAGAPREAEAAGRFALQTLPRECPVKFML
jgi:hypothetical protein